MEELKRNDRLSTDTYDEDAVLTYNRLYALYDLVEDTIESRLPGNGRSKSLCLTKLEESFMWLGKAIRDEQRSRKNTEMFT